MNHDHWKTFDVNALQTRIDAGWQPKYLFFWGHTPNGDQPVGKWCFSQWWEVPFIVDEETYQTAEHYMMAEKARLFDDEPAREAIIASSHPGEAKKLGRAVHGFDEAVWKQKRFEIVVAGNLAKFSQHQDLRDFLLGTGARVLVEASPRDRIWGIGMGERNPSATNPSEWRGLNLLGFALMCVRQRLRDVGD
ncbi:NADAR family protein [Thalassoroseus pseudoceratinae]|uniref:NADAR family protein n=1 Tax=Thalassoroseus pseudoceratinae TaxID=2713176 RepID=UPI0014200277|nr:NADAR family protein [Thalassoroseus pseudoceratinae]